MISEMQEVKKYAYQTLDHLKAKGEPVSYDDIDADVFAGDYQLAVDTKMWMLETGLVDNLVPEKEPDADPQACMRFLVPTPEGETWHGAYDFPYIVARYVEDETMWVYDCEITGDPCIHDAQLHCDECDVPKNR